MKHVWIRIFSAILMLCALGLIIAGAQLVLLHGSAYYLLIGLLYGCAAILLWRYRPAGGFLLLIGLLATLIWAVREVGWTYWPLFPRVMVPIGLAALGLGCSAALLRSANNPAAKRWRLGSAAMWLVLFGVLALGFKPHDVIQNPQAKPYQPSAETKPSTDWFAYGGTTSGLRYGQTNQINRQNVQKLELAWTYHTGDFGPGVDQNTPLQVGDTVYSCSPNDRITALDADTGKVRWTFDSKAKSPIWQRCRGLGYYKLTASDPAPTNGICTERIIHTTIDARLFALDAKTGEPCPDFGDHGMVSLSQNMGPYKPGFYFQTSAPLVARDKIVIGGWVVDNQTRGEPSGVVRAFNVVTGQLDWAWDLGNPNITKEPPPGQTYTLGTPNMWTTASYDDQLGLIYAPLGNATPDYFGQGRPPHADEYNSTLVALDVTTGRERWKFQTVHHDIWDYDLPSQPALLDAPDDQGKSVPAVLQATKRGQIFLLNRATGEPLAKVEEKPVPQNGAAPEEKLSPTQPYSVGMPTIGADRLTEQKMWGATMFDQLACRIAFHQVRYDGDFTPIGLTPAIQQPGNGGGMNWGSVSYDPINQMVYMNDLRIPSLYWLVKREDYAEAAKHKKPVPDGHGPSPMAETPYGEVTDFWMSKIGIPCNQPPYGTITAVDLKSRQIAWQVPAGTAEKLGPFGIASHLPMPVGVPTYAGTMTTAGGLVFFAGSQDYYLRAYDAQTGEEVWKYALPVGASATPMTYVSPKTGKQYIVVSVGGAAHSKDIGDYVFAFALPQ